MDKMKMHTVDITDSNIEKIGQLFPNCLTERIGDDSKVERVIDFDQLRQELSKEIVEGPQERYLFSWPDKKKAVRLANTSSSMTLRPCREDSVDFDNTENLYIEGDNLEVLKLLREDYLGKVKMIYIDPPYNTGKDFLYDDDYTAEVAEYEENSGQKDSQGNRLFTNSENNGRFHTDWLNMIYPRIKIARDLLANDGVCFISIDEHEFDNLRKVVNDIFGSPNYIGTIILQTATDNNPGQLKIEHEYILVVAKNRKALTNWSALNPKIELIAQKYKELKEEFVEPAQIQLALRKWIKGNKDLLKGVLHYDNVDERGVFHDGDIANTVFGGYTYDIIHPVTGKVCKMPEKGYRFPEETMREMLADGDIMFGPDEKTLPKPKIRIEDARELMRSVIYEDGRASTKHFEKLMARDIFQNPKSEVIISRLIDFICKDGDIVLDFFSGSGTTAESVFISALNKKLHFILVQLPENLDESILTASSKAKTTMKNAIKFLDSINKPHNICEIGKERIRRAGKAILSERENKDIDNDLFSIDDVNQTSLDIGFRVLKLDSSNMNDVYYRPEEFSEQLIKEDNVKEDRSSEDLLFQVMLECNLPLSAKIQTEKIAGKEVFTVNNGYLIACFDEDVNEDVIMEVAKRKPYYFVMRDSSLASDNVADNFEQIFQAYSKETIRRIL